MTCVKTYDYRMMKKYEADAMQLGTISAAKKGERVAQNLLSRLSLLERNLETETGFLQRSCEHEVSTNIQSIADDIFSALRAAANDLHGISVCPPAAQFAESPDGEAERYYKKIVLPEDSVCSFLEDDAIYVRTPMLWSRQNRRIRGDKGRTIGPERCTIYRDSVHYSILVDPRFCAYDFSKFKKKILHYLYVYRDLPSHSMYLIDNDNHESKYVTDAITRYLPAGDTPLSCNFYSSAVVTDSIPEGTYVTVTAFDLGIKAEADIIAFWKKKYDQFPKK